MATLAMAKVAGAHPAELAALRLRLDQLDDPQAGLLSGDDLEPLGELPGLDELPEPPPVRVREVLDRLAVVKLNGGLGTSMGLSGPKSLLEIKRGASFLDVLATQVLALRARHGTRTPLTRFPHRRALPDARRRRAQMEHAALRFWTALADDDLDQLRAARRPPP